MPYTWAMSSPLAQGTADSLRTMPKRLTKGARADFAMPGADEELRFDLESLDGRTKFLLILNRKGKFKLTKASYLETYRVTDVLARLDLNGPPHSNPSVSHAPMPLLAPYVGLTLPCPHFHLYVENFEARWAVPASVIGIDQTNDLVAALRQFLDVCGVEWAPDIQYPMQ